MRDFKDHLAQMLESHGLGPDPKFDESRPPDVWDLDWAVDEARHERLIALHEAAATAFWDGQRDSQGLGTAEPRLLHAQCQFRGGPGREADAAKGWAWELGTYFKRGIGEPPVVTYADGIYTVVGLMQTTHPNDHPNADGIVVFT